MEKYKLTVQATKDLYNIWKYTVNTWSETQADKYYTKLKAAFDEIASNPLTSVATYLGLTSFVIVKRASIVRLLICDFAPCPWGCLASLVEIDME